MFSEVQKFSRQESFYEIGWRKALVLAPIDIEGLVMKLKMCPMKRRNRDLKTLECFLMFELILDRISDWRQLSKKSTSFNPIRSILSLPWPIKRFVRLSNTIQFKNFYRHI